MKIEIEETKIKMKKQINMINWNRLESINTHKEYMGGNWEEYKPEEYSPYISLAEEEEKTKNIIIEKIANKKNIEAKECFEKKYFNSDKTEIIKRNIIVYIDISDIDMYDGCVDWYGYSVRILRDKTALFQCAVDNEQKKINIIKNSDININLTDDVRGIYIENTSYTEYARSYGHPDHEVRYRQLIFIGDDMRAYLIDLFRSKEKLKDGQLLTYDEVLQIVRPMQWKNDAQVQQQGDLLFKKTDIKIITKKLHERQNLGNHKFAVPVAMSDRYISIPETTELRHPSHPTIIFQPGIYEYTMTLNFSNNGGRD